MNTSKLKDTAQKILDLAEIKINGTNPWDIQVKNEKFYSRVLNQGSLGLGESYMDGWWDCPQLDEFFNRLLLAKIDRKIKGDWKLLVNLIFWRIFNQQSKSRAFEIGEKHYDIGNDLYQIMLDKRLVYTCAYWHNADNLDQAQENKLDLVCKKIGLQSGQKVLDIGCGWGSFARFAAEKYGAKVVGITVSQEQVDLAQKLCQGLPVEIRLQDYRDLNEKFDHIISLGMFEHVGYKNYRLYMEIVSRCLRDGGLFLLQTIAGNRSVKGNDAWIEKYIFPNSMLPSAEQIAKATDDLLVLEDWHSVGSDYDKTLMAWYQNFINGWDKIKDNYNERFFRLWQYYLLCSAGSFRARKNQLWQIVFSKNGVKGGYESIR
jgi:cyclopropane-fatty-acyl-phospholipid synthase